MGISVGVARPTQSISGVGNNYGFQGGQLSVQGSGYNPQASGNPQMQVVRKVAAAPTPTPVRSGGGAGGYGYAAPVYRTPVLDFASVNAEARRNAENAVNPYFTRKLNEFLEQIRSSRERGKQQSQMELEELATSEKSALENEDIRETQTLEDAVRAADILQQTEEQQQIQGGEQFAQVREELAGDVAAAGLASSGLGRQKITQAETERGKIEEEQGAQIDTERENVELGKTRTIGEIARNRTQVKEKAGQGRKSIQFNLDKFIEELGFEERNRRNEVEEARVQRVLGEEGRQRGNLVANFINSVRNPNERQLALQAYGRFL